MILIGFTGNGVGTAIGFITLLDFGTSLIIGNASGARGLSTGFSAGPCVAGTLSAARWVYSIIPGNCGPNNTFPLPRAGCMQTKAGSRKSTN